VITELPTEAPVTTPEVPTVAFELLLLQVPPPTSESEMDWPLQTEAGPVMAEGKGFTVTVAMALQPEL